MSDDEWNEEFQPTYKGVSIKSQNKIVKPLYDFFKKKINDKVPSTNLTYFMQALLHINIIRIEINENEEAFSLFERTNARGKALEVSDLLKNHIFMKKSDEDLEKIEEAWDIITQNSKNQIIRMLKYFYVSKNGYTTKSKLYRGIKKLGESNIDKLLDDIKEFSEFYDAFSNGNEFKINEILKAKSQNSSGAFSLDEANMSEAFKSIQGLNFFRITQVIPIIYSFLNCYEKLKLSDNKKFNKTIPLFLYYLESYHFINNFICDRVGNEVEKFYSEYSKEFHNILDISNFVECLNNFYGELKKKLAKYDEFESKFIEDLTYDHSNTLDIMYVFDRLINRNIKREWSLKHNFFNPEDRQLRKKFNIEHWYPQNSKINLDDKVDIHNIGNLLVIPNKLNKILQNHTPKKKAELIREDKQFYSITYVNDFIQEYKDDLESWDNNIIKLRANKLAYKVYNQTWKFDPPNIKIN